MTAQPGPYSFREVQSALPALSSPGHQHPWEGYRGYGRVGTSFPWLKFTLTFIISLISQDPQHFRQFTNTMDSLQLQ